jgi:N-methylhydantoinase A
LEEDGFPADRRELLLGAMARYVGQSSEIAVALELRPAAEVLAALPEAFAQEHERTYGFRAPADEPVELTALSLVARGIPAAPRLPQRIPPRAARPLPSRRAWFAGAGWTDTPVLDRAELGEVPRAGPVIVQEYDATCLVPPGMDVSRDGFGNLVLRRAG